jgi:hypothetical protein
LPASWFAGFGFTFGIGFALQTRFNASLNGIAGDAGSSFLGVAMPQPFRRQGVTQYMPDIDALAMRPQFAMHVGIIAGMWSFVESKMAELVSTILQADALVGATIYSVIRAEGARFAAIDAIANERLPKKDFDTWVALRKRVSSVGDRRNDVQHNLWDLPPEGVDGILLIDARKQSMINASGQAFSAKQVEHLDPDEVSRLLHSFKKHADRVMLYKEADFVNIQNEIRDLSIELVAFDLKLSLRNLRPLSGPLPAPDTHPKAAQKTKSSRPRSG